MRKVHYKVILDVFVNEDEDVDVQDAILCSDFDPSIEGDGDGFDVVDISVESVEVKDSR